MAARRMAKVVLTTISPIEKLVATCHSTGWRQVWQVWVSEDLEFSHTRVRGPVVIGKCANHGSLWAKPTKTVLCVE
jgi:hypothetical protein